MTISRARDNEPFKSNVDVFVAGDLFWYPVEGSNKIKLAPDTMVVFGRPKGMGGLITVEEIHSPTGSV
ncbi:hypothetical protein U9R62_06765 [Cylindrospermopsis raciborskii DSH]|uniref:hypothetical protein n=1 Tax=Cylindrospermopsis raciborskii TaxID=77022 RepID=UPI002ED88265